MKKTRIKSAPPLRKKKKRDISYFHLPMRHQLKIMKEQIDKLCLGTVQVPLEIAGFHNILVVLVNNTKSIEKRA